MTARTFNQLYLDNKDRLLSSLIGLLRSEDQAEDVVSAAFSAAFKHRHRFRGESSFYTWLYRIAMNCLNKRGSRKAVVSLDAMEGFEPQQWALPDILSETIERKECCIKLRRTLKCLPAVYRRTLVNHFVRGYSLRQIARREGVPQGTVMSRMFKAKRLLRLHWNSRSLERLNPMLI